jgi:hypothetical protein
MPIRNFPFTSIRSGDAPRPWLAIRIINPASYASLLGYDLQSGIERIIRTGNGVTTAYSHTTSLAIFNFKGDHVVTMEEILIDFMPNLHIVLLGVRSFLSRFVLTIHYPNQTFSIQWP